MKLQQNEDFVSAIDFLLLPGVEPEVARKLLDEGFRSLCDLAHSSQKQINKTEDMSEQMAGVVKDGALAAVGEKEPAAVKITAETSVSLPEAKQVVEGLAASEIRPSDSAEALVEMAQSEIFDFESVNNRDLYYLFEAGFSSVDDILETNPSKLSDTYFISTRQAQAIQQEAKKEYKSN
jgi:predicted RecB family nuclease